jgi:hypothetical protein
LKENDWLQLAKGNNRIKEFASMENEVTKILAELEII